MSVPQLYDDELETDDLVMDRGIAVIGMAGRFSKAHDLAQFWQNLRDGVDSVTHFSDEELLAAGVDPNLLNDPNYVKAGMLLAGAEEFDAGFFGYNAREAALLDPQQRLFMEHVWLSLENAGYASDKYEGLIGIYAGVAWNTYLLSNLTSNPHLFDPARVFETFITNDKDFMPTRVSYKLNLKGPSMIVQTSCSTSLVAIHLACLSLLNYECDIALAGGVTVKVPQASGYYHMEGGLASPDGYCRSFDEKGQGTIFGSGVGIVALKRLSEAIEDGDNILAVVKGSAINNDGSVKVSYTAPSVEGQAEVIAAAQTVADVEPETIQYIEAHGTATAIGDPIEVAALTKVFRRHTEEKNYCALGSVKSNLGHLDAAAGVAGFIKTVLSLKNKQIPPSLHFEKPNPKLDIESSPFYVNANLKPWPVNGTPRRAGVSSFGVGGTNAHVILEEAPSQPLANTSRPWQLLLWSAKTTTALETATHNLAAYLQETTDLNLADTAFTLQVGRNSFNQRRFAVVPTTTEGGAALTDGHFVTVSERPEGERRVVFMFTGQGAQYVNMGRDLYESEPFFKEQVDRCCDLLKPHLGFDLREVLYPNDGNADGLTERLQQTAVAQPALFVIEYALATLWQSWGIEPHAMIGHSIGEYVAACLAGVFELEDALNLVATRGRLMQEMPEGSMLMVALPPQEVEGFLLDGLSVAVVNSPTACVVAGADEAISQLAETLTVEGITCRRLHTSHAFHSPMMAAAEAPFLAAMSQVTFQPPEIPFLSNVTGNWITPAEATSPTYWAQHLRQPVRFSTGLAALIAEPEWILLEVGPGRMLGTLTRQQPKKQAKQVVLASLRHPQDTQSDVAFLLNTVGHLWAYGVMIDWQAFYGDEDRRRVPLPTYPFERQRYWIEPGQRTVSRSDTPPQATVRIEGKQADIKDWFYLPTWQRQLLTSSTTIDPCHWLVFIDELGLGKMIVARLQQQGHTVTLVRKGAIFGNGNGYRIDPQEPTTYHQLAQALKEKGTPPQAVLHLWSLSKTSSTFEMAQTNGYYSLLYLIQALGDQFGDDAIAINVVSSYMQQVAGEPEYHPEKRPLLGLCKVVPQEYPQFSCRTIDVSLPIQSQLARQVTLEVTTPVVMDTVAYRNQQRWCYSVEPLVVEETIVSPLRHHGCYLLTGGLDGVGYLIARYLVEQFEAHLLLIEPNFAPETAVNGHDNDPMRQRLEALGPNVTCLNVALTDAEAIRQAIAPYTVHGVIHAATASDEHAFRTISESQKQESEWHFAPKAKGAQALLTALAGAQLDFCLFASSLASVLGGRGSMSYAAANIFLDGLAQQANQSSNFPCLSLNWDAWQGTDDAQMVTMLNPELARYAMSPAEVGRVLQRSLSVNGTAQLIISTGDLRQRIAQLNNRLGSLRHNAHSVNGVQVDKLHSRPNLQTPYAAAGTDLQRTIVGIWQNSLGFEQVGIQDNFFDLGGDSLIAIRMVAQLKEKLGIELSAAQLFQCVTVESLAELIEQTGTDNKAAQFEERKEKMARRKQMQMRRRSRRSS